MRDNGAVTQQEHHLQPGQNLVSTTDLKGRILHCNPAFVAASGFSREELLGQPHNLIRHPDMPAEAFRDLWETISAGEPWSMLVKNRRKDGDHYWVRANVTPLMDGDRVAGYMSVRTVAERAEIEAADALYRQMRRAEVEGLPPTWRLRRGELVRCGLAGRWQGLAGALRERRLDVLPLAAAGATAWLTAALGPGWGLAIGLPLALAAFQLQRSLLRAPMHQLLRFAQRMAAGDLTQRVDVTRTGLEGRLQQALNQLNVNLQTVVGDARTEVEHMQSAVSDIAAGNLDLSGRTESQASGLQQTAASMEEITGAVRQNAGTARDSAALAEQTVGITETSCATVQAVRSTMHAISESSRRIAEITQVIDTISFQTNILALNAAVEAARAGEQGRGFAVVAGEVRSLAASTTGAAKEIKELIQRSQERIDSGVREVERAAVSMNDTSLSVARVRDLVATIHSASDEQLKAIGQINEAMSSLDSITQQNAAMVEQLSASAGALSERALVMKGSVQVFRTGSGPIELPDAVALRREARAKVA